MLKYTVGSLQRRSKLMIWCLAIAVAVIIYFIARAEGECNQRKRLETVVAKLRDKQTLNEQEIGIYLEAKKYDWLSGYKIPT